MQTDLVLFALFRPGSVLEFLFCVLSTAGSVPKLDPISYASQAVRYEKFSSHAGAFGKENKRLHYDPPIIPPPGTVVCSGASAWEMCMDAPGKPPALHKAQTRTSESHASPTIHWWRCSWWGLCFSYSWQGTIPLEQSSIHISLAMWVGEDFNSILLGTLWFFILIFLG